MDNPQEKKGISYPEAIRKVTAEMKGQKVLSNKMISGKFSKNWAGHKKDETTEFPIFKATALRKLGVFKF